MNTLDGKFKWPDKPDPKFVQMCLAEFGFLKKIGYKLTPPPERRADQSQVRFANGKIAVVFQISPDCPGYWASAHLEVHGGNGRGIHVNPFWPLREESQQSVPRSEEDNLHAIAMRLKLDFMDVLTGDEAHFHERQRQQLRETCEFTNLLKAQR